MAKGSKSARRVAPVPANRGPGGRLPSPRRSQLASARCPGPGWSLTGPARLQRMRVRSPPAEDPGQEALRRTDRQTQTAVDSLRGPVGNNPSAGRGGAEGADSPRRRRVQLGLGRAAGGWGLHDPGPHRLPPSGAAIPGLGAPGNLGRGSAGAESAQPASRTGMGTQEARPLGAGVPEGGTARGGGRCRPRAASGPERHRPPVDPLRQARPSAPPRGPRRRAPAAEGGHPFRLVGWGRSAGRGRWAA